jgi:hypothetical protein
MIASNNSYNLRTYSPAMAGPTWFLVSMLYDNLMIFSFLFYRTPNYPIEPDSYAARQDKNRIKNIEWTAYENIHKKYLILGQYPR